MLDVKAAVKAGGEFLADIFAEEGIKDIRLEEVELQENADGPPDWRITFSFLRNRKAEGVTPWGEALMRTLGPVAERDIKVVCVNNSGQVSAMKQWVAG